MFSRHKNGTRALFTVLGVGSLLAPAILSACGSSKATPSSGTPEASTPAMGVGVGVGDGAVQLIMIVTGGGGAPTTSSPFGRTGSTSGSGDDASSDDATMDDSSSGSTSGATSGQTSGMTSGTTSGQPDDAGDDAPNGDGGDASSMCGAYVPITCGSTACDLRSNTCCVTLQLQARCIKGANAACNSNEATLHCGNACDCPNNTVCCGVENTIQGVIQTVCQNVPEPGFCSPYPQTSTQASGQLCKESWECRNQQECIYQSCVYGAKLHVCGLQSQAPFNCTVADGG